MRLFSQCAYTRPMLLQQMPMSRPVKIIVPRFTSSSSATNRGPGVGGTSEWVIVPPATSATTKST